MEYNIGENKNRRKTDSQTIEVNWEPNLRHKTPKNDCQIRKRKNGVSSRPVKS